MKILPTYWTPLQRKIEKISTLNREEDLVGGLIAIAVAIGFISRIWGNSPFAPELILNWYGAIQKLGLFTPILGVFYLGLRNKDFLESIGFILIGVFSVLSLIPELATISRVFVTICGSIVLYRQIDRTKIDKKSMFVSGLFFLSIVFSFVSQSLSSVFSLLGLTFSGIITGLNILGIFIGLTIFVGVLYISFISPFILGDTSLIGWNVVDVSSFLIATALGGSIGSLSTGLANTLGSSVIGVTILLSTGTPTTTPQILVIFIGIMFLLKKNRNIKDTKKYG